MKNKYLTLLIVCLGLQLQSQVNWAKKGGLWAYDYGYGVVTDNNNNIYLAGKFEENAIFGSFTANCQGNHDAYIMKYSPNGSEQWLKTAGGPNGDYAWGISTDKTNFLFVAGEIEGSSPVIFSGSTITLQGAGDNDVFVSKWDLDGNLIWAKREGVVSSEKALSVANDNSGNVYISGYFTDNSSFNGSALSGYGGRDIFVAKYDPNGNFLWVTKAGGSGRDEAKCVRTDNNGSVYICGMFTGNATFGNISASSSDGAQDSYLAKLSAADGSFQWVKKGDAILDDVAWSLTLDNGGSIYVTGEFNSYISFQNSAVGLPTTGATNIYVAKIDATGNAQWIRGGGGPMLDRARGIGTDGTNIYVTGQFGGAAAFGAINVSAADSSDVFVAKMDAAGNYVWVTTGGGPADTPEPLGYESGIAVTADASAVYATGGMLRDTTCSSCAAIDFAGFGLTGFSRVDMFLVSIASGGVGIRELGANNTDPVFPNPATTGFFIPISDSNSEQTLIVRDINARVVKQIQVSDGAWVDLADCENGCYIIDLIRADNSTSHYKLVVQH